MRGECPFTCQAAFCRCNMLRSLCFRDETVALALILATACRMRQLGRIVCDEMREDLKYAQIPSFFAIPFASLRDWAGTFLPMHMMTRDVVLTSSAIAEGGVDRIVTPGAKTFADLHVVPHKTTSGIAIDHVRHWRKGGYNMGTNEPQAA